MRISDWSSDVCSSDLNQTALHEDVALFVAEQKERNFHECQISQNTTVDGDHGRIETRANTVIHNLDWLPKAHGWPGLKTVGIVDSIRETGDKATPETRRHLNSAQLPRPEESRRGKECVSTCRVWWSQ